MQLLVFGRRIGLDHQRDHFALEIHAGVQKANTKLGRPNAKPGGSNAKSGRPKASQWNMVHVGYARFAFALGMYISCCLCPFRLHWVPNGNPVSSGIWALKTIVPFVCAHPPFAAFTIGS